MRIRIASPFDGIGRCVARHSSISSVISLLSRTAVSSVIFATRLAMRRNVVGAELDAFVNTVLCII